MPSPTSLLRAKALSRSVLRSALDAEASVAQARELRSAEAKQDRERLVNTAKVSIEEHLAIVKHDEDRIVGSDDAIKQSGACLRSLQHARYAHFAATQVCERRLELRKERPPKAGGQSLAPRDAVQEALETQQLELSVARQRLLQLEARARKVLQELEGVRSRLSRDAAQRRLAVEQDRAWIISLASISSSSTSQAPLPPRPPEPEGIANEESRSLSLYVMELEAAVKQLKVEGAAEIQHLREEANRSQAKVGELLMRSTYSLDEVGRRLKEQAKEVDGTIKHAERSLHETRKNLIKTDKVGAAKVAALEALIEDVKSTRKDLQVDIVLKAALLGVDERCRKVTAAMASEKGTVAAAASMLGSTAKLLTVSPESNLAKTASVSWFGMKA